MGLDFSLSLCFVFICFVADFSLFLFILLRVCLRYILLLHFVFGLRRSFIVSISTLDDTRWKSAHRSDGRNREMTTTTSMMTTISTTITTVSLMEKRSALRLQSDSVFGVMDIFIGKLRIIFPVGENYTPHKTANSDCVWLSECEMRCHTTIYATTTHKIHFHYIVANDVE